MSSSDETMRDDYSDVMNEGVRGKYFLRAMASEGFVQLDPELRKAFPSAEAVNQALRTLLAHREEGITTSGRNGA